MADDQPPPLASSLPWRQTIRGRRIAEVPDGVYEIRSERHRVCLLIDRVEIARDQSLRVILSRAEFERQKRRRERLVVDAAQVARDRMHGGTLGEVGL